MLKVVSALAAKGTLTIRDLASGISFSGGSCALRTVFNSLALQVNPFGSPSLHSMVHWISQPRHRTLSTVSTGMLLMPALSVVGKSHPAEQAPENLVCAS